MTIISITLRTIPMMASGLYVSFLLLDKNIVAQTIDAILNGIAKAIIPISGKTNDMMA